MEVGEDGTMDPGLGDQHIRTGVPIYSADEQLMGEVGGIDSGHLRVKPGAGEPYWLVLNAVETVTDERVLLAFRASQLDEYRHTDAPA